MGVVPRAIVVETRAVILAARELKGIVRRAALRQHPTKRLVDVARRHGVTRVGKGQRGPEYVRQVVVVCSVALRGLGNPR